MSKPCIDCAHPTNRHDTRCYNCYYMQPDSFNPQTQFEALTIEYERYSCACGETRTPVLILMCKGVAFMPVGPPRSDRPSPRDRRAMLVGNDASLWYARCHNCHHQNLSRSPGRPPKYNDEERKWNRNNYPKIYRANLKAKIIRSYGSDGKWPTCLVCDLPATRTLYIGEFGQAPLGNHYWRCRKAGLTDPSWHIQFAPYCDNHEVSNIGQRKVEKTKLTNAQIADAQYKSTLSFAEHEARQ